MPFPVGACCDVCLSTNRNLSLVESSLLFDTGSPHVDNINHQLKICWECKAILGKLQKFKAQVLKAQALLKLGTPNICFSQLQTAVNTTYDKEWFFQELIEVEIKEEIESSDIWVNSVPFNDIDEIQCKTEPTEEDFTSHYNKNCEINNLENKVVKKNDTTTRKDDFKIKKHEVKKHRQKLTNQPISIPDRNATTGTFDCEICGAKLKSAEYYRVHHVAHISKQQYECDVCGKTYNTRRMIMVHLKNHRPMKFLCDICGIPNKSRHTLKIHKHSHASFEERRYKCDLCQIKFSMPDKLKIHKIRHTGVKNYKCHLCVYSFFVKFELTKHLQTHHGIEPHTKRNQQQRTRSAVTNKPLQSVAERNVCTVKQGKRLNTDKVDRSINDSCDICGKSFPSAVAMKRHKVVHTEERPYKCNICNKTFKYRSNVLTHNASVHTQEKSHECRTCGAKFKLKGNLTVHMKTHTGDKPFSCDICKQKFIRKRNLNNHYIKIHMK